MVDLNLTTQTAIDSEILHLNNWDVTLHFDHAEGHDSPFELFQSTDHSH